MAREKGMVRMPLAQDWMGGGGLGSTPDLAWQHHRGPSFRQGWGAQGECSLQLGGPQCLVLPYIPTEMHPPLGAGIGIRHGHRTLQPSVGLGQLCQVALGSSVLRVGRGLLPLHGQPARSKYWHAWLGISLELTVQPSWPAGSWQAPALIRSSWFPASCCPGPPSRGQGVCGAQVPANASLQGTGSEQQEGTLWFSLVSFSPQGAPALRGHGAELGREGLQLQPLAGPATEIPSPGDPRQEGGYKSSLARSPSERGPWVRTAWPGSSRGPA